MSSPKQRPLPQSLGLPFTGADSHAHLDDERLLPDLSGMLERAVSSGVSLIVHMFLQHERYAANRNVILEAAAALPKAPDICFARGLASKREDWAQIVWYVNLVGESALDQMFYLPDLREIIPPTAFYGAKNCGSTIQLPFGFVQWHSPRKVIPGSMQFHHSYAKLSQL